LKLSGAVTKSILVTTLEDMRNGLQRFYNRRGEERKEEEFVELVFFKFLILL